MADEGSTRKRRNREFEEAALAATLNDHVSNGNRARRRRVKTSRCDVFSESVDDVLAPHTPQQAREK